MNNVESLLSIQKGRRSHLKMKKIVLSRTWHFVDFYEFRPGEEMSPDHPPDSFWSYLTDELKWIILVYKAASIEWFLLWKHICVTHISSPVLSLFHLRLFWHAFQGSWAYSMTARWIYTVFIKKSILAISLLSRRDTCSISVLRVTFKVSHTIWKNKFQDHKCVTSP